MAHRDGNSMALPRCIGMAGVFLIRSTFSSGSHRERNIGFIIIITH